MQEYPARFYEAGQGKSSPVSVSLSDHLLCVKKNGGGGNEISLSHLDIRLGGFCDDRVVLVNRLTQEGIVCKDRAFLEALAESQIPAELANQLKTAKSNLNSMPRRRLFAWAFAASVLLFLCLIVYLLFSATYSFLSDHVPSQVEEELGRRALAGYKADHQLDTTSASAKRLSRIGKILFLHSQNAQDEFRFYVCTDADANTFSTPGGNIVLASDLLKMTGSDDEIAGLIAHEMGHVIHHHALKSSLRGAGLLLTLQAVFSANPDTAANLLANYMVRDGHKFSLSQEQEADKAGLKLCYQSGYDPEGLFNFIKRCGQNAASGQALYFPYTYDHPTSTKREATMAREAKRLRAGLAAAYGGTFSVMALAREADRQFKMHNFAQSKIAYQKVLDACEAKPGPELYGVWDSLGNYRALLNDEDDNEAAKNLSSALPALEKRIYMDYVCKTLNRLWHPPEGETPSAVVVYFEIAQDGSVGHLALVRTNGRRLDNEAALQAVKDAEPFLCPPSLLLPLKIQFKFDYQIKEK